MNTEYSIKSPLNASRSHLRPMARDAAGLLAKSGIHTEKTASHAARALQRRCGSTITALQCAPSTELLFTEPRTLAILSALGRSGCLSVTHRSRVEWHVPHVAALLGRAAFVGPAVLRCSKNTSEANLIRGDENAK